MLRIVKEAEQWDPSQVAKVTPMCRHGAAMRVVLTSGLFLHTDAFTYP